LLPIEAIVADSDIRQFLQVGVPPELTRSALRTAWAADPEIRGFIGIADNQWDFNSEGAIPGFGALTAGDYVSGLLALVRPSRAAEDADGPGAGTPLPDQSCRRGDTLAVATEIPDADGVIPTPTAEEEPRPSPGVKHSHGGALPK
jgi:hypothetical protein